MCENCDPAKIYPGKCIGISDIMKMTCAECGDIVDPRKFGIEELFKKTRNELTDNRVLSTA